MEKQILIKKSRQCASPCNNGFEDVQISKTGKIGCHCLQVTTTAVFRHSSSFIVKIPNDMGIKIVVVTFKLLLERTDAITQCSLNKVNWISIILLTGYSAKSS